MLELQKTKGGLLILIALITILILISFTLFAGSYLIRKDRLLKADAIVLLMGSIPDRVLQVYDVYNAGLANRIIIVEENMSGFNALTNKGVTIISNSSQCRNALMQLGIDCTSITVLPGNARSTLMEAQIIKSYIKLHPEIDTLIVVTSSHHTRRAGLIIDHVLNKGENYKPVYIMTSPSVYNDFNPKHWYTRKEDIQIVMSEWIKLFAWWGMERWKN